MTNLKLVGDNTPKKESMLVIKFGLTGEVDWEYINCEHLRISQILYGIKCAEFSLMQHDSEKFEDVD